MKRILVLVVGFTLATPAMSGSLNISTGTNPGWQVYDPPTVPVSAAVAVSANASWAAAPAGSSWVSYGLQQSTSCVVGQTPGNGCASALINPTGDQWNYQLTILKAQLGATSGTMSLEFAGDDSVNFYVGNHSTPQFNGASNSLESLTAPFGAGNLNPDGSLTLYATVLNIPVPDCPICGDPTGLLVSGIVTTNTAPVPLPPTAWLLLSSLAAIGLMARRRNGSTSAVA